MATVEAVPELADGGYWYHVAVATEEFPPGSGEVVSRPMMPATHSGWCAWYMEDGTAVVRSPVPIVGVDTISLTVANQLIGDQLGPDGVTIRPRFQSKPFGRIGGR